MFTKSRGIPSLDGLRAISIAMVVISHIAVNVYYSYSSSFTRTGSIIQTLFLVGHLGVTVFFVISGFLITTLLLKEEKIDLRKFYFRRTLRIFPPYYFYLLVMLGLGLAGFLKISWFNFTAAFTYTRNYFFDNSAPDAWYLAHTWSLSVEEQFYLLFPALLLFLGRKRGLTAVAFVIILCPLIRLAYVFYNPEISISFARFETVADALAVGCLLAGSREWLHRQKWYAGFLSSSFALLAPFLALLITWLGYFPKYYSKPFYVLIAITVQNVCIALFLDWAVTNYDGRIGRLLNARPIAFIGVMSYSIYLWQQPFLDPELSLPIAVKVILLILASLGSYYLIEKPSLKFRHYLEKRKLPDAKKVSETFVGKDEIGEAKL